MGSRGIIGEALERGLSQAEAARIAGISRQRVSQLVEKDVNLKNGQIKRKTDKERAAKRASTEAIKNYRRKHGLSQTQMARLIEVSTTTIRNWEHNRHRPNRKKILGTIRGLVRRAAIQ